MRAMRFLALILLFVIPGFVLAQSSFELVPDEETEYTVDAGGFHEFVNILNNVSDSEEVFVISLAGDNYPDGWNTSMCKGQLCYPPQIRTFNDTLAIGSHDTIKVDFHVGDAGDGSVWLVVFNINDPADADSILYTVHAVENGITDATSSSQPSDFGIDLIYPNPFNSTVNVSFTIPRQGITGLNVYTVSGRLVATLSSEVYSEGNHVVSYQMPSTLASGVYLIRLESDNRISFARAVLLK